ncbi:glycosyl hydrolase 108 family protein [Sphingomonas sp. AOB5]|uniref:glycosyl hydrolase 108 family protein n=1 Tax=Sphingomonas sp. AOB5 TaxID=3034017 RepID=UPI0023F9A1F4|nr:glycosyl hydrolase 108 family protein [Sphingomonas sp. AOB5]MDF7776891.1 glycosyl hydrolase 108 family protein [Sphingomonas sp. AOB5]
MGGTSDEIVVTAFGPRYRRAYKVLAPIEGLYSNDKDDRGGPTKYGASLRFLVAEGQIDLDEDGIADFDLDMDGDIDIDDIRALQPIDAMYLFQRCFWNRLDCDNIPAPLGEAMFDQAVNGGLVASAKLLQRAINASFSRARSQAATPPAILHVDGDIGTATRGGLDWVLQYPALGMPFLIQKYRDAAADRYRAIVAALPSQRKYLDGWLRRARELGRI